MAQGLPKLVIFEGELTDAPGRMESWTEWLTHIKADKWKLSVEGTDFDGTGKAETQSEHFTTEELLLWLKEQDYHYEPNRRVGPRLRALRAYAEKAKLVKLLNLIEGVRKGTWPPKLPSPKVKTVSGITLVQTSPHNRAEFIVPYIKVDTTRGPGIMAMPSSTSMFVHCWLGTHPFSSESWKCRLTKSLVSQVRAQIVERLKREPEIPIIFFTVVILAASIASRYRGGSHEFSQAYPASVQNSFLRAIPIMSSGELQEILERMQVCGLIPGRDVAVGEMMHGEWIACSGIRFERHGEFPFSKWFAIYDPMYAANSNTGLQSDAAQAPPS